MSGATVGAAIGSAAAGITGSLINLIGTHMTNQSNEAINQRNLDFQAAQTQAQWERDDNAHQREVADLQAAGLSPLASMNGAQNSQALDAPSPIAMQAPQVDTSALVNAAVNSEKLKEDIRSHKANEDLRDKEIKVSIDELELKAEQLKIQDKDVESQIKYRVQLAKNEENRIAETVRSNKANEKLRQSEYELKNLEYESKRYYEEIKHQAGGENVPYKVYNNYDDYLSARQTYLDALNKVIDDFVANPTKFGHNVNNHGGGNLGSSVLGSVGLNYGEGESKYTDISDAAKAEWVKFQHKYPVPVFMNK